MKYMRDGGFRDNPLKKLSMGLALVFLAVFWVSGFLLYFSKMDLSPVSVAGYYLGSESEFRSPRTYQSMVEVTHGHLPMMAMVILFLTHLLIFTPMRNKKKAGLILAAFLSALLNEASGWLVRFISPGFAYLKVSCFLIFQAAFFLIMAALGRFLLSSSGKQKSNR